jgi:DNA-binding protein HU-beta
MWEKVINKSELIDVIASKSGLPRADACRALDATTNIINKAMSDGNNIHLTDFGSFIVRGQPALASIKKQIDGIMKINESKVVEFKAGKNFNKIVNQ